MIKMYTDGSCRPNPGIMGIGVHVVHNPRLNLSLTVGYGTNNLAEWLAYEAALKLAIEHGWTEVAIRSDSQLVVNCAMHNWKVRSPNLATTAQRVMLLQSHPLLSVTAMWIPREENEIADALASSATTSPGLIDRS